MPFTGSDVELMTVIAAIATVMMQASASPTMSGPGRAPPTMIAIPHNATMRIGGSTLYLTRRLAPGEKHMPVDIFFQSLAESQKGRAIGVILSGTGSDGTLGLRAIKAAPTRHIVKRAPAIPRSS